jgi:hypothetical protein
MPYLISSMMSLKLSEVKIAQTMDSYMTLETNIYKVNLQARWTQH